MTVLTDPTHSWLPADQALAWLQVEATDTGRAGVVELCRAAAAAWCEEQRRDLFADVVVETVNPDGTTTITYAAPPAPSDSVVMAGVLATARLYARRSSPAGLASYGEFGAAEVLRLDPDVSRLLGVGRYAPPVCR